MHVLWSKNTFHHSLPSFGNSLVPVVSQEILVGHFSTPPGTQLLLPTTIRASNTYLPVLSLVHSGVGKNLISPELIDQSQILVAHPGLGHPVTIVALIGQTLATITHKTEKKLFCDLLEPSQTW